MSKKNSEHQGKRLARLAAVQGLYRVELTQHAARDVIRDFAAYPPELTLEGAVNEPGAVVDQELFGQIITGVTEDPAALDAMIAGALDSRHSAGRIEILLRAILRAGAFELHQHGPVSSGIIINDYVDVAHAFFAAKEPGLVNAVLDKLAKNLRLS